MSTNDSDSALDVLVFMWRSWREAPNGEEELAKYLREMSQQTSGETSRDYLRMSKMIPQAKRLLKEQEKKEGNGTA